MSFLLIVILVLIIAIIVRFYQKSTNAICTSTKRLDGKTALVTGGTTGMGLEIAKDFARRGAHVIIACPFKEEGIEARKQIVEASGNGKIVFKELDLASFDSVRKFAADILNTEERLDILVNNAGVVFLDDYITDDGISFILQVNYFGHFLLNLKLLPLLNKTGKPETPSRIINTTSLSHSYGKFDTNEMSKASNKFIFSKVQKYADSKFFFIPFSKELTRRLKNINANVVINNVDPGVVGTKIYDSAGMLVGVSLRKLFSLLFKTPKQGAQTAIFASVDTKAGQVSGEFFKNCKLSRANCLANDEVTTIKLWNESVRLVKLDDLELEESFKTS